MCAEAQGAGARPTFEKVKRFAHLLRLLRDDHAHRPDEKPRLLLDAGSLAPQLDALRMGPPPEHLDGDLLQVWAAVQHAWASAVVFGNLEEEVQRLLSPHRQSAGALQEAESELREREERLEALRTLADLLDELLKAA